MDPARVAQLRAVADKIGAVEERHNDVVDTYEHVQERTADGQAELRAAIDALEEEFSALREDIQERLHRAKRATVLLSLIAQQEAVSPLKNRLDNQKYEEYAESSWFKARLHDALGGRDRDA